MLKVGKPVLLSIIPNLCNRYIPRSVKGVLPFLLTDMFDKDLLEATYECEEAFNNLGVSNEQAQELGQDNGEIIFCENDAYPIGWFHTKCLKLSIIPERKWYCPECRLTVKS